MVTLAEKTSDVSVTRAQQIGMLQRRMAAMELVPEAIASLEPEIFEHLQISCAACEYPDLCELDLRNILAAPDVRGMPAGWGWDDYCPNVALLNTLSELSWFRSRIIV